MTNTSPSPDLRDLRELARLLDAKFKLPLGLKIGWDGILGLIPVVGDSVTNVASIYILYKAAWVGCPPSVLLRMGINILIDNVVDVVPFLGNIFDFFWKSNTKNIEIVEEYFRNPRRTTWTSRIMVLATLALITGVLIAMVYFAVLITYKIWQYIAGLAQA